MKKADYKYGRKIKLRDYRGALTNGISRTIWRILQKSDCYVVDFHSPKEGKRYSTVDFVCRLENGAFSDCVWTCDTRMIATETEWYRENRLHFSKGVYEDERY